MTRNGRLRNFLPITLLLAVVAACSDSDTPTDPGRPFERRITLRAGSSVGQTIDSVQVTVGFLGITFDSRCPIDAICVQAGEAKGNFFLELVRGAAVEFQLSTVEPRSIETSGFRVSLESVSPAPRSDVPINPRDYTVELIISR